MLFVKVPEPLVDQAKLLKFVALAPEMLSVPELAHVERAGPAFTVGAVFIVNTLVEVTVVHGAVAPADKVSVTLPAVISAPLGVYVGVKVVAPVNVPVPLLVQFTLVAFGALAPVILTAPALEQVVWFPPASGVGAAVIVKVFVEVTVEQGALPVTVKVSVTIPAVISPALGV